MQFKTGTSEDRASTTHCYIPGVPTKANLEFQAPVVEHLQEE